MHSLCVGETFGSLPPTQEKLQGRRERDRQRRAEEIAEQREERLARRLERRRKLYVLPRRDTHAWMRTELIITAGELQRLPRRDMLPRESLMLSCVDDQLCLDPGVCLSLVVCSCRLALCLSRRLANLFSLCCRFFLFFFL